MTTEMQQSSSSSSPPLLSPSRVFVSLPDPCVNRVEEAGANHFERFSPPLNHTEQFYVQVAQVYQQQQQEKENKKKKKSKQKHKQADITGAEQQQHQQQPSSPDAFTHLSAAKRVLDHFTAMLDLLCSKQVLNMIPITNEPPAGEHSREKKEYSLTATDEDADLSPSEQAAADEFRFTRRNRLAVLIQTQHKYLDEAAAVLRDKYTQLHLTLQHHQTFMDDLRHLSSFFLIRHKPTTASTTLPPLLVELRIGEIGGKRRDAAHRGVLLHRDDSGRVFVPDAVGQLSEQQKREQEDGTATQRRRKHAPQETTMTDAVAAADGVSPPSPASSTSAVGWRAVSDRLHHAQRQLICHQLFLCLMRDARQYSAARLSTSSSSTPAEKATTRVVFTASVLHTTITVESATFPRLTITFPDGPNYPFNMQLHSVPTDTLQPLTVQSLYLSVTSILLHYHQRNAEANRPSLVTLLPAGQGAWKEEEPNLLEYIVTHVYHQWLVSQVRQRIDRHVIQTRGKHSLAPNAHLLYHPLTTLHSFSCTLFIAPKRFAMQVSVNQLQLSVMLAVPAAVIPAFALGMDVALSVPAPVSAPLQSSAAHAEFIICSNLQHFEQLLQCPLHMYATQTASPHQ